MKRKRTPDHFKCGMCENKTCFTAGVTWRRGSWERELSHLRSALHNTPILWLPQIRCNNRPLSLLAVASKVLERIVLNQFSAYLTKNNRLTSHQSGNKKAHSTETLNILLTDKILEAIDKKQITALVLLDLSKAFDSIDHARLLHKLSILGASPSTVKWFKIIFL